MSYTVKKLSECDPEFLFLARSPYTLKEFGEPSGEYCVVSDKGYFGFAVGSKEWCEYYAAIPESRKESWFKRTIRFLPDKYRQWKHRHDGPYDWMTRRMP